MIRKNVNWRRAEGGKRSLESENVNWSKAVYSLRNASNDLKIPLNGLK